MGTDKTNSQTAIIVAAITVFGTLGASLFANWDKIFPPKEQPSSSASTVETPAPNATSDEPQVLETTPNSPPAATDGFAGFWSSEKDVTAEYLLDIILKSDGTTLSGEIQSFNQAGEDQSPSFPIAGEVNGDQGVISISDQNGAVIGKAELTLANATLRLKMLEVQGLVQETFPTEATLYPIDAADF